MTGPARRQARIRDLLERGPVASQEQLQSLLAKDGLRATQATISRDLRELGVVKGPDGYVLPSNQQRSRAGPASLQRALAAYLVSAKAAGVLVVLKTGPGHAQVIALELDRLPPEGVLGTIAGDDTIFVAAESTKRAQELAADLREAARLD
jgi:transcriptional regulator of arginine metabolism